MTVADAVTVDVAPFFSDPDGDALTYQAASSDSAVVKVGISGASLTVTAAATGTATVTVTATDPDGLAAQQTFQVKVSTPPPPTGLSVDLRIEPPQSEFDAFRVLADPAFSADRFDLKVFIITGDDAATWEFVNDQPITADEGRVELQDLNSGATPQPLEGVTKIRVVTTRA